MCLAAVVLVPGTLHAQAKRTITHIAGDLYRLQNDFHFSAFLVTPKGVIATDPINAEAATWLEAEIDKRFAQPIKYLVLSHDHADHSSGGEVFADTATVIAHDRARTFGQPRLTVVPDITFSNRTTREAGIWALQVVAVPKVSLVVAAHRGSGITLAAGDGA